MRKINFYYCFFFIVILLFGCNKLEYSTVLTRGISSIDVDVKIDTLEISIDPPLLNDYEIFSVEDDIIISYNDKNHSIDFFDLHNVSYIKSIILEKEGPYGINRVLSIDGNIEKHVHLLTESHIVKIKQDGSIISKIKINSKVDSDIFFKYNIHVEDNNIFKVIDEDIYLVSIVDITSPRTDKRYFENDKYVVGKFNSMTGVLEPISISYPNEYQQKNQGFNSFKYFSVDKSGDLTIVFSGSQDIFKYYNNTNILNRYKVENNLPLLHISGENWSSNNSYDKAFSNYIKSSTFGPIFETNNLIIRLYRSSMPEEVKSMSLSSKRKFISFYSKDFELIKELEMFGNLDWERGFVSNNILFIPIVGKSESSLSFIKVSVVE